MWILDIMGYQQVKLAPVQWVSGAATLQIAQQLLQVVFLWSGRMAQDMGFQHPSGAGV